MWHGKRLALLSAIFGFVKWSTAAGICGLLTTGVLTIPNLFNVREHVDYYQYISSQTTVLLLETAVSSEPTAEDVTRWRDRFKRLLDFVVTHTKDPEQLTRVLIQGS